MPLSIGLKPTPRDNAVAAKIGGQTAMEDTFFYSSKVSTSQVRADDMELERLLQRAAEFLRRRRSPADQATTDITSENATDF
jgi:hypothetical protein